MHLVWSHHKEGLTHVLYCTLDEDKHNKATLCSQHVAQPHYNSTYCQLNWTVRVLMFAVAPLSLGNAYLTKQKVFIGKLWDLSSSIGPVDVYYNINKALVFIFYYLLCLLSSFCNSVLLSQSVRLQQKPHVLYRNFIPQSFFSLPFVFF